MEFYSHSIELQGDIKEVNKLMKSFTTKMETVVQQHVTTITNSGNETILDCTADMNAHYSNMKNEFNEMQQSLNKFQNELQSKMIFFGTLGDLVTKTENTFKATLEDLTIQHK